MYLKRVELENFKSFGRKFTVPFLEGFTAITGPNGSGKSNIGDAILFVLGPKSNKAIRAGKLTDLIFNGGKEKKASTHCQVSLVFANEDRVIPVDADEVTLTRLIKLSKSDPENYYSYFYVNGRASSLSEFDEMLAKSRISAEGYNITRQGDVTRIVEMTPVQRRQVVDEIAGITRFDSDIDKARAERTAVEANLERIRIILDEIDRQLATLSREREMALKHKALKDELDATRAKLARRRRDALEADLADTTRKIELATHERAEALRALEDLQAQLRDSDAALADVERRIVERGGPEARELRVKLDAIRNEAVRATERANYAKSEAQEIKQELTELAGDLKRVETEQRKYVKERDAAIADKTKADAGLAEKETALEAVRSRISEAAGRGGDIQRELADLKIRFEKTGLDLHEARLAHERATERKARLTSAVAEVHESQETQRFAIRDAEWEVQEAEKLATAGDPEKVRTEVFGLKREESRIAGELRELEPAVRRLQNDYARLRAESDASEAVSKGYNRAVNALIAARDQGQLRGICGTIAELGAVDEKFGLAMEVAAGGRMQAIVTETDEDAAMAIDFLKRGRLGRATFLPLSKMVPGRPAGKPLMAVRSEDSEGFAIDRIRFDERYRSAFWYVFRDTVIAKNLAGARRLMGGVRLVTLEGDLIDAGGAMTGGDRESASGNRMKFGASEAAQLEDVGKRLRAAVAHQEALSQELDEVRARLAATESTLRDASAGARERETRLAEAGRRKAEAESKLQALANQASELKRDLLACDGEITEHAHTITRLTSAIEAMETERDAKSKLLLAATSKELAKELETLDREVGKLRERVRDLASQVETRSHQVVLVEERRSEVEGRVAQAQAKLAEQARVGEEMAALAESKEQELAVLLALEAQQNEALQALQSERDTLVKARADLSTLAEKARSTANLKEDAATAARMRIPGIEASIREVDEEIATLTVPVPDHVTEGQEELRSKARRIESQLEMLGNVNMLALEEYDRQNARKGELVTEVERLEGERENLILLVDSIVARKKEGFFKVFDEINQNFATMFDRLSAGGRAELILENPEDPFAAGMSMRAQPRGKKVTRLEALSGGEKGLASMALILALQQYAPSPFYYLDEVDMNLDGINSELLAKLVKDESKHAQFIVVSLRKVTLKEADHVYGVTMMESGLSEIVGEVRISELADEPLPAPEAAP